MIFTLKHQEPQRQLKQNMSIEKKMYPELKCEL